MPSSPSTMPCQETRMTLKLRSIAALDNNTRTERSLSAPNCPCPHLPKPHSAPLASQRVNSKSCTNHPQFPASSIQHTVQVSDWRDAVLSRVCPCWIWVKEIDFGMRWVWNTMRTRAVVYPVRAPAQKGKTECIFWARKFVGGDVRAMIAEKEAGSRLTGDQVE